MQNGLQKQSAVKRQSTRRSGWSLVEMLVVIGIVGLLASLMLPALQSARMAASRTQCQNNLRQIGMALTTHATMSATRQLPGGGGPSLAEVETGVTLQRRSFDGSPAKREHQAWGWAYQLLPYLDLENRWLNPSDRSVRSSHVRVYLCPSRERQSFTFADQTVGAMHYVGNACSNCDLAASVPPSQPKEKEQGKRGPAVIAATWGASGGRVDGVFVPTQAADGTAATSPLSLDRITDGLSNTILVAEKRELTSLTPCNNTTGWVSGYPIQQEALVYGHDTLFSGREGPPAEDERVQDVQCTSRAGGPHGLAGNVLFADGSVRLIAIDVDADLWRAMLSVAGQEDVDFIAGRVLSD